MTPPVAFLGPVGTYTYQAVLQEFGNPSDSFEFRPQGSIAACFEALDAGAVDYAVVPLENSTNGQVVFTYDLLRDWFVPLASKTAPSFGVVGEQFVPIRHNVLSNALDLSQVKTVYSHPQVWGQVTAFMKSDLAKTWTRVDVLSTAEAAERISHDPTNTSACISSLASAELYGLPIMVPNVEDKKENTTRFLVLGRKEGQKDGSGLDNGSGKRDGVFITSVMFVLDHNNPGALCEALFSFKQKNLNLRSIASRPSGRAQWEYVFFVEVEGHFQEGRVSESLCLLEASCSLVAVLGLFLRSNNLI